MINYKTLPIEEVFKKNKAFKEISLVKNLIFWVDSVQKGKRLRNCIFVRPFNQKGLSPQKLTCDQFNIGSHFHGYGGKSYKCIDFGEKIYLIWIDQISKSLWMQIFEFNKLRENKVNQYLFCKNQPIQLTKSKEGNFDSCFVIANENILFGLYEENNKDYLFSLDLKKIKQEIYIVKQFDNFAGNLSANNKANYFSWIEWGGPYMPWEKNDLFFASINEYGELNNIKKFKNKIINSNQKVSFFQPYWISEYMLVCSEDSSGWWNLLFIDATNYDNIFIKKRIIKKFFEYGIPQWISGLSLFSGSKNNLFCLAKYQNSWILENYQYLSFVRQIKLPFTLLSDLNVSDKKLVLKGSNNICSEKLLELDLDEIQSANFLKEISLSDSDKFSKAESLWFKGFNDKPTHAFIYKPLIDKFQKPPLIVKAHSGPTSCFDGSFNSEVQYWTSLGFTVAEVNYGGSSGFGREYRERLNYKWGILDSYDCKALVLHLVRLNLVDSSRVAILGNSAGGLTALNSLYDNDLFKAAICKYPVLDLNDMYFETHRFEKDYLNSLVGNYSKYRNEYKIRSPIHKINIFKKPILLFHGKQDLVISYKQILKIKEKLLKNNEHSEIIFFENEGHGFKNIKNQKQVLKKSHEFLEKTLNS